MIIMFAALSSLWPTRAPVLLSRLVTIIKRLVHHAVYCISLSCLLSFLCNPYIPFLIYKKIVFTCKTIIIILLYFLQFKSYCINHAYCLFSTLVTATAHNLKNATHCGSLTKPRPGRLLDPDPMQAENADSGGLTRIPIRPPTFARSAAGPPGGDGGSICTLRSQLFLNVYVHYIVFFNERKYFMRAGSGNSDIETSELKH